MRQVHGVRRVCRVWRGLRLYAGRHPVADISELWFVSLTRRVWKGDPPAVTYPFSVEGVTLQSSVGLMVRQR